MTSNRSTLKKYFEDGSLPSQDQFHDLIDSSLNLSDDGFRKTPSEGLQVSTLGGEQALLTFLRDIRSVHHPLWRLGFDKDHEGTLVFQELLHADHNDESDTSLENRAPPTLVLGRNGRVGINTADPRYSLDVGGTLRVQRRIGVVPPRALDAEKVPPAVVAPGVVPPVHADGEWHDITEDLEGCHAFEVVAGVGKKDTGRYALLQAKAINAFQPVGFFFNLFGWKNRIRCHQSWYRARADKLSLRWVGEKHAYRLQVRSNTDYGTGADGAPVQIRYHVTDLWDDPLMEGSWNPGRRRP